MRRLARILALAVTTAALLALPLPALARHLPVESEFEHTDNMHLVGFAPRANTIDPFTANSDLAFWRNLAFQGHYDGFRILDISRPSRPRELVFQECFGNQGDVVVWGDILIRSWNSPAPAGVTCDGQPIPEGSRACTSSTSPTYATRSWSARWKPNAAPIPPSSPQT